MTCAFGVQAAEPRVTAHLEPDSIFIGDRFDLVIEIEKDVMQQIGFPEFENENEGGIELVEDHAYDTLTRDGREMRLRKRYTFAAFEEGHFNLGRAGVLYVDKNVVDTLYADEENLLWVDTFVIDSTSREIYDLKPQKNLPFRFGEISGWLFTGLAIAAALALLIWLIVRYLKKRGKSLRSLFKPAPPLPPHIAAIKALEELRNRKLWQNGRFKEYYSGLSDILRTYICGRYGISAMEKTTDKIVEAMRSVEMPPKCMADLTTVLQDADLVKFAKFEPEPEQNENDYDKVYYFVEETKEVEPQEGDEQEILDQQLKGR